jgi:hypothetical protein
MMRRQVPRTARAFFWAVLAMTAGACGGGNSNPGGPSGTVAVFISVQQHTGAFTLTLGSETISTDGDHRFSVPPGVQQVTGQITLGPSISGGLETGLELRVHGLEGMDTGRLGGPQRGSIQSSEGPNPFASECNLRYSTNSSTTQSSSLRFSFNVVASSNSANDKC